MGRDDLLGCQDDLGNSNGASKGGILYQTDGLIGKRQGEPF